MSLFMFDLQNEALPLSFKTYLHQRNAINHSPMHTRQHDLIQKERPRTNFSTKLPKHNFTNIWNGISTTIRKATHRHKCKSLLRQHYLNQYKSKVNCIIQYTYRLPLMILTHNKHYLEYYTFIHRPLNVL